MPAVGSLRTYNVAASVVVTLAFEAANVPPSKLIVAKLGVVAEAEVVASV